MKNIQPTDILEGRWIAELEQRAGYRMIFSFFATIFMATLFIPDLLNFFPSPTLPIRILRLTSLSLIFYLSLTGIVDLLFLHVKALTLCRNLAQEHKWAEQLPALYKTVLHRFLWTIIKRMNMKRTIWFSCNCGLLVTGMWLQAMTLQMIKP